LTTAIAPTLAFISRLLDDCMDETSPMGLSSTGLAQSAISARGLVKTFGKLRAVDGVDLDVPRGMIFAILGPNGADHRTGFRGTG
jgi:ABC-2 type transport system ATP-binding protein